MLDAYDHWMVSAENWRRAARCEMLDELKKFVLLMRHSYIKSGEERKFFDREGFTDGIFGVTVHGRRKPLAKAIIVLSGKHHGSRHVPK